MARFSVIRNFLEQSPDGAQIQLGGGASPSVQTKGRSLAQGQLYLNTLIYNNKYPRTFILIRANPYTGFAYFLRIFL